MNYFELTGYYTYRSFLNNPDPVEDFNKIAFAEGELFLHVTADGTVTGTLAFPADALAESKGFMDITGRVTDMATGAVEVEGIGRAGTDTAEFDHKYRGRFTPSFEDATMPRPAMSGTVIRAKPHGDAKAGFTASFVAVKRDYLRPRAVPAAALIPEAVAMFAARRHRLQHNVWHVVRMNWIALNKEVTAVAEIDKRGWWPKRPPFLDNRALNLENGAGEDFLFMHRRMIAMLKETYQAAGKPAPKGWTTLPNATVPQVVYKPSADGKSFVIDADASGFMVPPPGNEDALDQLMKSPTFLSGTMRPVLALFQSPRWLSGLTLGQLGNLIEWSIHGWMHNRWGDNVIDAATGDPVVRASLFDIDPKWDDSANDDLSDFYSAHVHPTFWRLHGWIDDRIEAWAAVHPEAKRIDLAGVSWFAVDGKSVLAADPFSWPESGHHHHGTDDVKVMEEVMAIMEKALTPPTPPGPPSITASGALKPSSDITRRPARLAFRDALLALSLPDLIG